MIFFFSLIGTCVLFLVPEMIVYLFVRSPLAGRKAVCPYEGSPRSLSHQGRVCLTLLRASFCLSPSKLR